MRQGGLLGVDGDQRRDSRGLLPFLATRGVIDAIMIVDLPQSAPQSAA
jgi:hypothetical protein